MGTVVKLPTSRPQNLDGLMELMREKYPNAKRGLFLVFDDEAGMDGSFFCNDTEMALASIHLAKIVTEWGK